MQENQSLDYLLYVIQHNLIKHYNRKVLNGHHLSYQHYLVLLVVHEQGQIPVLQLGKLLAYQSGTITPIIKKMEANGLITRMRSQEDERIVIVDLTETGREKIMQLKNVPKEVFDYSKLTFEEYKELIALTNKLTNKLTNNFKF